MFSTDGSATSSAAVPMPTSVNRSGSNAAKHASSSDVVSQTSSPSMSLTTMSRVSPTSRSSSSAKLGLISASSDAPGRNARPSRMMGRSSSTLS